MNVRGIAMVMVCLTACSASSLSYTVDDDQLREMSRQGQLWVFDAENELVVASDQLDESRDVLRDVRRRLGLAERSLELAEKGGRPLAVGVAEARVEYLEQLEQWAEEQVRLRIFGLTVARATVELAKAQVIRREDLLGGKSFSITDFQQQRDDVVAEAARRRKRVNGLRKKARQKEAQWWQLRRRYIAQTGDHDTGLWID